MLFPRILLHHPFSSMSPTCQQYPCEEAARAYALMCTHMGQPKPTQEYKVHHSSAIQHAREILKLWRLCLAPVLDFLTVCYSTPDLDMIGVEELLSC